MHRYEFRPLDSSWFGSINRFKTDFVPKLLSMRGFLKRIETKWDLSDYITIKLRHKENWYLVSNLGLHDSDSSDTAMDLKISGDLFTLEKCPLMNLAFRVQTLLTAKVSLQKKSYLKQAWANSQDGR